MSLLNDASLILTPNAVKEGKLYSVIPSNGNGDMTVVRATSTATRTNELGLIEFTPYNLLNYSENFSNIIWQKLNGSSISLNTNYTNPSGGSSTYKYTASNLAFGGILRQQSTLIIAATTYTFSFFCKKDNYRYIGIRFNTSINAQRFPNYDFDTDTLNTQGAIGVTLSRELFSNGWVKLVLTYTSTTTAGTCDIGITSPNGATEIPLIGGESVYIWGAQLVQGSVQKDYFYTTDRLNVPRLNYEVAGGCPSILIEPQRTNLVLRSEEFENASWAKNGVSVIANSIISPDGAIDSDTITSTTAGQARIEQSLAVPTINTTYTFSVYAKASSSPFVALTRFSGNIAFAIFNLSNGTIINQTSGVNATIISVGNEWYRISFIINALTTDTASVFKIHPCTSTDPFSSVVGNSIYLWGAQIEVGAYPTSYIPTITATTRNADVISKTAISDLIGQTEGTLFCDLRFTNVGTEKYIITVSDTTLNNAISLRRFATGEIRAFFTATTSSGTTSQTSAVVPNGICKLAYIYKSGSLKLFINGVLSFILTPTFTFGSSLQKIDIGSDIFSGRQLGDSINSIQLYKTALTDAECIALTTL